MALCLGLAGCGVGTVPPSVTPSVTGGAPTPTQPPVETLPVPTAVAGPQTLVVWLPPQFDPTSGSPAAEKLRSRLEKFQAANPDYKVEVRIKAVTGPGSLLETLAITSAAAPANLPALIALPRPDLEAASLKGLVFTLDGLTHLADDPDWYAYARQLAQIQGSVYGLPFAGDVALLLYHLPQIPTPPADWPGVFRYNFPLAFPAADPQSSLTLALYLSAGGQIKDSQGRPTLQADVLGKVLRLYADGAKQGVLPAWLAQYQTDGQAWQAFREQRAQFLLTWSSRLLAEPVSEIGVLGLPSLGPAGSSPLTLATGWVWALSEPAVDRRPAAVRLAEDLSSSDFMAQWTAAAGYLPTRPTALAAWSNQGLKAALSQIVLAAQAIPPSDLLASLGPILRDATLEVLKQGTDPVQVAQTAADRLATPQNR